MTRRERRLERTTKALFLGAFAVLLQAGFAPAARADLVVLQESNGFPGAQEGDTALQKVFISGERLRVVDERHGWALFVRLDKKVVHEASSVDKTYVEKPLSDYAQIRARREQTRAEKISEYKKLVEKAKNDTERAQLKRDLEAQGLREDGRTLARLEQFPDETKTVSLVVNDKKKDFKVEHYIVRENEGPPVFDVWVATGLGRPDNVFKFYKEIGTFSDPVVEKVMELPGFPVEITATLDDGNNKKTFKTKVFEVRDEAISATEYEVPAGFTMVTANAGPREKTSQCEICQKEFVPGVDGGLLWRDPWTRAPHPVCSDEHRRELIKRLAEKQRKP